VRREEIHEAWVPPGGAWSLWARPVLFAQMPEDPVSPGPTAGAPLAFRLPDPVWAPSAEEGAVLVIDLPGGESVAAGLALAARGYRPVPLFNACTGPKEVIDQGPILRGLRAGAPHLASLSLPPDAPPAFLLDDGRMEPKKPLEPEVFDNRWMVFPEDFPSARLLRARGFTRAVLVQRSRLQPRPDLAHVLRRWQEAGIAVEARDPDIATPPRPIVVDRPARYRGMWYRVLALLGLRAAPIGGFGSVIPKPSSG
jgi:hypothetical protein